MQFPYLENHGLYLATVLLSLVTKVSESWAGGPTYPPVTALQWGWALRTTFWDFFWPATVPAPGRISYRCKRRVVGGGGVGGFRTAGGVLLY